MIKIENVTKRYGDFAAVSDVSFQANRGRITGFLGPNGAGKSTSMRIMVGLTPADSGRATIDGAQYHEISNPGRLVGVLLDASAQHNGRTGREVLRISADTMGVPRTRVDEMLTLVGLSSTEAKRRVRNYSLGMRQRLGIANALLGEPEVLILDEPVNGLDPAGIHWMRGMLRHFADNGGTVLLSSHLLHEVEQTADDLVLIGNGRIAAAGPKETLLQRKGCHVQTIDPQALESGLQARGLAFTPAGNGAYSVEADPVEVGRAAAQAGAVLVELRAGDGAGLEDLFFQLTADSSRETPPGMSSNVEGQR
jgi:ABC-2 type transport system ATP-binding protein